MEPKPRNMDLCSVHRRSDITQKIAAAALPAAATLSVETCTSKIGTENS